MSKKLLESSSLDDPDSVENDKNLKKEELKLKDAEAFREETSDTSTAAESLQSAPAPRPSQSGNAADSEKDSSELTPVTKLSGRLGMLSTKTQLRQTPKHCITYSSDEMGASTDSAGKSVSWDSPSPIDSPIFEKGSGFINRAKSFPLIHRRPQYCKPRNLTECLTMAHASTVAAPEDSNSGDSMSLLQAFVDDQGAQDSKDLPQASQGHPQGFQGLLHSQGSLGDQRSQEDQKSKEDQDVGMETDFKVPSLVGSRRSHFSSVSEGGSSPSRPGSGKRGRSDDIPEGGRGSSLGAKRVHFDNHGDGSGPSHTSSGKFCFGGTPGDGSGPSRAGSSKQLFSSDKPGEGSRLSRTESSKRLFSDDKPGDGSSPSRAGSSKELFSSDKPGDGNGSSHAGSSKRLLSDDKPGDGSGPSHAGSSKRLFSDNKPGSKRSRYSDSSEDDSSPSKKSMKTNSSPQSCEETPGGLSGLMEESDTAASDFFSRENTPSSPSGVFQEEDENTPVRKYGKAKRAMLRFQSVIVQSRTQEFGNPFPTPSCEETPGGLSGLMEESDTAASDFFSRENTPPPPSGVFQEEDENTPVRKYGKAKRAMLRSQSVIVQSRTQEFGNPFPTPNLSPGSLHRSHSASQASIKDAVHRMTEDPNLIADSSKLCLLPTIYGKHQDLKSISHDTLADLINGKYAEEVEGFHIVDCRYPYEYNGGHIKNAINIYKQTELLDRYIKNVKVQDRNKRFFLIFHCEFSSERGPTLFRHLRKTDRQFNSDRYPYLFYPEMYLLEKGYSHFFEFYKCNPNMLACSKIQDLFIVYTQDLCEPQNYIRMLDEKFKEELVEYDDEKKKAGGKKKTSSLNLGAGGSKGRTPAAFRSLNLP